MSKRNQPEPELPFEKRENITWTSACCDAPMRTGGDSSTHWHVCTKCNQPCDRVFRKSKGRRPATERIYQDLDNLTAGELVNLIRKCAELLEAKV